MIATQSGVWTSFFGQSDLDLASYITHPQDISENFNFPKYLCDDIVPDIACQVDDLIRALEASVPSIQPFSEFDIVHKEQSPITPTTVVQQTPPTSPKYDGDDDEDCELKDDATCIPRHKRPAHKRAEVKRRGKIKTSLDDLRDLLPTIHSQRKSESLILAKAVDHCRHLKARKGDLDEEKIKLRAEIAALTAEIDSFQKELPAMGLKVDDVSRTKSMKDMYDDYVKESTKTNWKFWIFSFMMRPLYNTYAAAVEQVTIRNLASSVQRWADDNLALTNIRSVFTKSVLQISKETNILNSPATLQTEALQSTIVTS